MKPHRKAISIFFVMISILSFHGNHHVLFAEDLPLSDLFDQVNPTVVKIFAVQQRGQINAVSALGSVSSGVVISKDGLVMTAAHSVQLADKVVVEFLNDETVDAKVVASSNQADVALLHLTSVPSELKVAKLGDSNQVRVGDRVFVIGAPYGVEHTLTVGHISGRRTSRIVCQQLIPFEFLQTDAAINEGNSGGPLFDTNGRLIGIVSGILSKSGGSEGLGFAASINTAKAMLIDRRSFWVGFDAFFLAGELAKAFNLPQDAGLLVQNVARNSPGESLGLKGGHITAQIGGDKFLIGGDVILTIQDVPVMESKEDFCTIQNVVGGFTKESIIRVKVLRDGKIVQLPIEK